MDDKMLIGEVAQKAKVTPRTIRYYESLGLLSPIEREGSGFRYYGPQTLARLKKIDYLKNLNFTLDEIKAVIEVYYTDDTNRQGKLKIMEILQAHLKETDEKIAAFRQFRAEAIEQIERLRKSIEETPAS